ncbi:hypothetical protein P9112_004353 [Eukaryota sp. TZLM1-RC]
MSSLPVSQSVLLSLSNLKDTVQQCLEELREKTDGLTSAENRIRDMETEITDLQRRLRSACSENAELQDTVRSLRKENGKLQSFKRSILESVQEDSYVASPAKSFASTSKTPPQARPSVSFSTGPGLDKSDLGPEMSRLSSSSHSSSRNMASSITDELLAEIDTVSQRRSDSSGIFSSPTSGDGREFFRKARSELSYEKFSKFLSVIKELNSRRLSREDALRAARELFLAENPVLYSEFARLLDRFNEQLM